jgi:hypothetical protein
MQRIILERSAISFQQSASGSRRPKAIKPLVERGSFGIGVFETDDIQGDYERLSGRGVESVSPPEEQFYGTEDIVKDNSGNWFSLTERKR